MTDKPQPAAVTPRVDAEFNRAAVILVHEPGPELLTALIWPEQSSFQSAFDAAAAAREHQAYVDALRAAGSEVYKVTDLLSWNPALRERAAEAITYLTDGGEEPPDADEFVRDMGEADLFRLLLERPKLRPSAPGTFAPSMTTNPMSNLYFTRDQMITTDRGIVLGRFRRVGRQGETELMKFALEALGITPLYQIVAPGTLEGGDFMAFGEWALLGVGSRTNTDAVDQLTSVPGSRALGYRKLAVINDPETNEALKQQEMHLDTYFSILGPDCCLVESTRIDHALPPGQQIPDEFRDISGDTRIPSVDIYEKQDDESYTRIAGGVTFPDFLKHHLGMQRVLLMTMEDQAQYGCNVLLTAPDSIIGSQSDWQTTTYARQLWEYQRVFRSAGINLALLDFSNIRRGYGANHCMTQVIVRG